MSHWLTHEHTKDEESRQVILCTGISITAKEGNVFFGRTVDLEMMLTLILNCDF